MKQFIKEGDKNNDLNCSLRSLNCACMGSFHMGQQHTQNVMHTSEVHGGDYNTTIIYELREFEDELEEQSLFLENQGQVVIINFFMNIIKRVTAPVPIAKFQDLSNKSIISAAKCVLLQDF